MTRLKTELSAPILTIEDINLIFEKINRINITDPKVRAEHIEKAKANKTAP